MRKVSHRVCTTIIVIVILTLCVWRATTDLPHWYPIDYIGILAFGFTLLTAWFAFFIKRDVKQLSDKYSLKLALPDVKKRLEKIRKNLTSFWDSRDNIVNPNVDLSHNCCSLSFRM